MHLSSYGEIVREKWANSTEIRREIDLDVFVIIPNHLHGIVVLLSTQGARLESGHASLDQSGAAKSLVPISRGLTLSPNTPASPATRATAGSPYVCSMLCTQSSIRAATSTELLKGQRA